MASDRPRAFTDTPQLKVMRAAMGATTPVTAANRAFGAEWAHIVRVELGGPAPETRT